MYINRNYYGRSRACSALFSKSPTYIHTVKITDSRVRSHESLSRILEGKNFRTVVIYLP
jgi:hypothetical protein